MINIYRVFKNKGPKVLGYYTAKKRFKGLYKNSSGPQVPNIDKMHQGSQVYHFEINSEVNELE